MATIFIDGHQHEADERKNLLEVCLREGYDLPYFCWHPAMGSVGACRQCAVRVFQGEDDEQGKIVMSCMTGVQDGARVSIADEEASDFRAQVIEWLMANHPHDCPVCDEGGECHLQDMTVMSGHTERRYRFPKRTFRNQYLGPFLNHEMNRCIECYRCVRFYRDYAGGRDLDVFASARRVYFGRHEDGVLENEFSGNLAEVCPTGVFTDKTLKQHYTRKWDLQMAPSVCVHCGAGCNTSPGERYGSLRRIVNRYNSHVNGYFLCDRGRFGYEFVNGEERVHQPLVRREDGPAAVSEQEAFRVAGEILRSNERVLGVGSPRSSLEANFALRSLVGPEHFFLGISETDAEIAKLAAEAFREGPAPAASLPEQEGSDGVFILGEDVSNTSPRTALALRQAAQVKPRRMADEFKIPAWHEGAVRDLIQDRTGPFYVVTPAATRLDELAQLALRAAPDDAARMGFAVAHELDPEAPPVDGLTDEESRAAKQIAEGLLSAEQPIVVSGAGCQSPAVVRAAVNVAWALRKAGKPASLTIALPEANTMGLALLGGRPLQELGEELEPESAALVVVENDLFRRFDAQTAGELLERASGVIAIDSIETEVTRRADVVLPCGTFAESDGVFVNQEGRAQAFYQVLSPQDAVPESWRRLAGTARAAGRDEFSAWRSLDDVRRALREQAPVFSALSELAPEADFRIHGERIPRQPHRYSGRTAMTANENVNERHAPPDPDSPLAFSMEGASRGLPPVLQPFFAAPGWNSIQSTFKFQQEMNGELEGGDPGVRLLEPASGAAPGYFTGPPARFRREQGRWLALPVPHIFGSEELSRLAPAVRERIPEAYAALHPEDAAEAEIEAGGMVEITRNGATARLPVKLTAEMARGVAGLPSGWDETHDFSAPAWVELSKAEVSEAQ